MQHTPEDTAHLRGYTIKFNTYSGKRSIVRALENFLKKVKKEATYRHWCGEYLSPDFIAQAGQLYNNIFVLQLIRENNLKAFCIWSSQVQLTAEAEGLDLYNERSTAFNGKLVMQNMSEILAWCSTEHEAGYLVLQVALSKAPHRGFIVEAHDERAHAAYLEAGFTPVYTKKKDKWHEYRDTLALV
jgi:hypothetical protein